MSAILPIFVVEGHTGEYSDRSDWCVAAFTSRERADAFLLVCENWAIDNHLFRSGRRPPTSVSGRHDEPRGATPPTALPAVLAWLKTQPHSTGSYYGGGERVADPRGHTRDDGFDWTERYDWKTNLGDAIRAGAVDVPDQRIAQCDDGVDYVVIEIPLSFGTKADVEDFCDALIAVREKLPQFTAAPKEQE